MSDPSFADALSDSEVRIWINACNHEPARQALRQLLAYRIRGVSVPLADPIPEAPADEEVASAIATHRHKKRGTEYVLIGYGKMQAERWGMNARLDTSDGGYGFVVTEPVDMREVAIYRSATDPTEMWVRPREEFEDGRFEPLPRSTTGGAK